MNIWTLLLHVENLLDFYNLSVGSALENHLYEILFWSSYHNYMLKEVVKLFLKDL